MYPATLQMRLRSPPTILVTFITITLLLSWLLLLLHTGLFLLPLLQYTTAVPENALRRYICIYAYYMVSLLGGGVSSSSSVPLNILCLIPGPHLSKMPLLPLEAARTSPWNSKWSNGSFRKWRGVYLVFWCGSFFLIMHLIDATRARCGVKSRRRPCETLKIFYRQSPKTIKYKN